MPMNSAHLETISHRNTRLVPVQPHVKSVETCELFNADAGTPAQFAKSADPACYNSLTVDLTGLFENMESNMKQVGNYVMEIHDTTAEDRWGVRMAGAEEYISKHPNYASALAAIKRYTAADKRRAA